MRINHALALVLTIAALAVGKSSVWAMSSFTVTTPNGSNTFRIKRTGNTTVSETVDWRVVSLSAIAGIHFTGNNGNYEGTVTFNANETYKDVIISECAPGNNAYQYQIGGMRKYRFEVLDKDGYLLAQKDREINTGTGVPSPNVFSEKSVTVFTEAKTITDTGYDQSDRYNAVPISDYFSNAAPQDYLRQIEAELHLTVDLEAAEEIDGYQHIQILVNQTTNCDHNNSDDNPGTISYSHYLCCFSHDQSNTPATDYKRYSFPVTSVGDWTYDGDQFLPWTSLGNAIGELRGQRFRDGCRASSDGKLIIPTDLNTLGIRFDAGGNGDDVWFVKNVYAKIQAFDDIRPTALDAYVVSGGRHQKGNTIYVSVAFSEIVTVTGTPTLDTNWGTLSYTEGSGSNVLTFKGTIDPTDNNPFRVYSYSGTIKDLAGNNLLGYIYYKSSTVLDNEYVWSTSDFNTLADNTYEVASKNDLRHLALLVNVVKNDCRDLTFQQTCDITCDNTYTPIGYYNDSQDQASFSGTYDGNNKTVSGITVLRTGHADGDGYVGLFGYVSFGTVKNVVLARSTFTGFVYVGGIVGYNTNSTVENCRVESTVTIKAGSDHAACHGGIAGFNNSDIIGCFSAANIQQNNISVYEYCGGIVGNLCYGIVRDCIYTGTTVEANYFKGAIVGNKEGSSVTTNNYYTNIDLGGVGEEYSSSDQDGAVHTDGIPLLDNYSNDFVITTYKGVANQGYTLAGRTLTKNGAWNTLCLPFDVTDGDTTDDFSFTGTPLEGATVKELDASNTGTSLNTTNGLLTLKFKEATSIEAGKPYIVKWTTTGDNITNPTFTGVTIDNSDEAQARMTVTSADGNVKFEGQYSPFTIGDTSSGTFDGDLNEILFVGSGSQVGYSANEKTLKCFRAHFWVQPNGDGSPAARSFVLDFGEESTGIREIEAYGAYEPYKAYGANEANGPYEANRPYKTAWYTLDGRQLSGKPTAKGLYIHGGRKTVIK